jgi:hypothetical protein
VKRWIDPQWYAYLWESANGSVQLTVAFAAVAALTLGGFFTVKALGASTPRTASTPAYISVTRTVQKLVKVKE